jgi:hypothetical protein
MCCFKKVFKTPSVVCSKINFSRINNFINLREKLTRLVLINYHMKLSSKILAVAFVAAIALVAVPALAASFDVNMTVGSSGPEVSALQSTLVAGGYLTMPAGVPMGFFGGLTKAAVAKYQVANGITPAVGFVGPITRAALNNAGGVVVNPGTGALCPNGNTLASNCSLAPNAQAVPLCPNGMTLASNCAVAPGTGVSANGTDGTLTAAQSSYVSSGIQVKKGETKNILAETLKASIGPVTVTRAGVHFNARPWLLFSQVVLKDSTGRVIATKSLSSAADATEITVGTDYLVTFDGVNYTVTPGINQDLTVAVTVLPATDKIPTAGLTVETAFDTLRTINGIGWTDTIPAGTMAATAGVGNSVFTLTSTGSVADIFVRISPNTPATRQVATSLTQVTTDVVLGTFSVKSANNSAQLNTMTVTLASTTLASGTVSAALPTTAFSNVRLFNGSTSYGGTLTSAGVVTFSNLTIPLSQDVWNDLTVKADVSASTTATGLTVALSNNGTGVVVTDANYGTATYESGTATSNATTLTTNALMVSNTSATLGSAITNTTATVGYNALYTFTLTNTGNNDLYVSASSSIMVATTTTGTAGSSTLPTVQSVSPASMAGDVAAPAALASYIISAGSSRTFTLAGAIRGTTGQTGVNLKVTTIYYGTTPTAALAQAANINFGLDNLVTSASF